MLMLMVISQCGMDAVQDTKEPACLRLFLDYQGLPLLWSWMVDVPTTAVDFKTQVQQRRRSVAVDVCLVVDRTCWSVYKYYFYFYSKQN